MDLMGLRISRVFTLAAIAWQARINEEQVLQVLWASYGTQDVAALTPQQFTELEQRLRAKIPPQQQRPF